MTCLPVATAVLRQGSPMYRCDTLYDPPLMHALLQLGVVEQRITADALIRNIDTTKHTCNVTPYQCLAVPAAKRL